VIAGLIGVTIGASLLAGEATPAATR
jgi:hypothetical protein